MFHPQKKHPEVNSSKYSAARRIFNSLLSVLSGIVTVHGVSCLLWYITWMFKINFNTDCIHILWLRKSDIWYPLTWSGGRTHKWTNGREYRRFRPTKFSCIRINITKLHYSWSSAARAKCARDPLLPSFNKCVSQQQQQQQQQQQALFAWPYMYI